MYPVTLVLVGTGAHVFQLLLSLVDGSCLCVCVSSVASAVGSGKSTFAHQLVQTSQTNWTRVNQDSLKSRQKCEMVAKQTLAASNNVVIDRMNFDCDQRAHWIKLAAKFRSPCYALCLKHPADVCATRGAERQHHEGDVTGDKAKQLSTRMSIVISGVKQPTHKLPSS